MGKETHNNDPVSGLDPELEAQIVALIHGELSGEEQNRIESEIGRIPAAAIFRQRIESLHELLGEPPQQEEEEWMLAPERREQLLETLSTGSAQGAGKELVAVDVLKERRTARAGRRVMWSVAACFGFTLFLVTLLTEPWMVLRQQGPVDTRLDSQADSMDSLERMPAPAAFRAEPAAEVEGFAADFAASAADPEMDLPEAAEGRRVVPEPSLVQPGVALQKAAAPSVEKEAELAEAFEQEPTSPPAKGGRSLRIKPAALPEQGASRPSAGADAPLSLPGTISQAVDSPEEPGWGAPEGELKSLAEEPEEGEKKSREVAFLGVGLFFGLLFGLLFGLGFGRTWQRRAHSSH